jgi:hypothetical protein
VAAAAEQAMHLLPEAVAPTAAAVATGIAAGVTAIAAAAAATTAATPTATTAAPDRGPIGGTLDDRLGGGGGRGRRLPREPGRAYQQVRNIHEGILRLVRLGPRAAAPLLGTSIFLQAWPACAFRSSVSTEPTPRPLAREEFGLPNSAPLFRPPLQPPFSRLPQRPNRPGGRESRVCAARQGVRDRQNGGPRGLARLPAVV